MPAQKTNSLNQYHPTRLDFLVQQITYQETTKDKFFSECGLDNPERRFNNR